MSRAGSSSAAWPGTSASPQSTAPSGPQGRKIVLLLRLSPVFPFNLLNYALGLTRVRFADYLVASIGMLPGTLLYVYYGKVAGDVARLAGGAAVQRGAAYYGVAGAGTGRHGGRDDARGPHGASRAAGGDRWHPWRRLTRGRARLETKPDGDVRVEPFDQFNQELVANVHPAGWVNPEPRERYHLVVIGAGTARARHRVDRRRPGRAGRAGRALPDGRGLPQRGLRAVEGHHQRRPLVADGDRIAPALRRPGRERAGRLRRR